MIGGFLILVTQMWLKMAIRHLAPLEYKMPIAPITDYMLRIDILRDLALQTTVREYILRESSTEFIKFWLADNDALERRQKIGINKVVL